MSFFGRRAIESRNFRGNGLSGAAGDLFRRLAPVLLFAAALSGLRARPAREESPVEDRGDPAVAERYLDWAEQSAAEGGWTEALGALERAADFSDVSSDLSYFLALARFREGKSRRAVLEAAGRSLAANRWKRYDPAQARLLAAEQLIALRDYSAALGSLDPVPDSADASALRLAALKGLCFAGGGSEAEFRRRMLESLNRYPRDPRLPKILFEYARRSPPGADDYALMELALRRLPFVLEADPDLAWMAAPFIRDTEEARRLVAAYRAGGLSPAQKGNFRPAAASIPAALNLGLLGDREAVEELFAPPPPGAAPRSEVRSRSPDSESFAPPDSGGADPVIDRDLIVAVSDLLRSDSARNRFAEKLLAFSGLITADEDRDGFPESRALYYRGTIRFYGYDADQDGLDELLISFDSGGVPRQAEQLVLPENEDVRAAFSGLPAGERSGALIQWERYPSVRWAKLGETTFIPRPGDFQFAPVSFTALAGSARYRGLPYPVRDHRHSRLTERALVSFALRVERPSAEFEGAVETVELNREIPLGAVETLNGRVVSRTEFENGRPVLQRLDLDLDSRLETVRRFRRLENSGKDPLNYAKMVEFSESDWDGDGIYETAEAYGEDGSVIRLWDMDRDGVREYAETIDRK